MAERRTGELILLDTHIWIGSVDKNPRLRHDFEEIIVSNWQNICVSVISCWGISMLASKKRLNLGISPQGWFERVIGESGIIVLPLTPRVAANAYQLPGNFHPDPADRMIVATARDRNCLLFTEDSKVLNYPHVRTM